MVRAEVFGEYRHVGVIDMREKQVFRANIILAFLFFITSIVVSMGVMDAFDRSSMIALQGVVPRSWDLPFSLVTLLGSSEVTTCIVLSVFAYFLFRKNRIFAGIFAFFTIFVIELAGKTIIYHPGPPALFRRFSLFFHFPSTYLVRTNFSFPSGHTARTAFLVVLFVLLVGYAKFPRHKKILAIAAACMFLAVVVVSRISLGEHWFSDVLGGLLLGSWIATIAHTYGTMNIGFLQTLRKKKK